ncbi:FAD-dependent monooxygenase [Terrabacter sp. MAHUQ-38]|uniref:FAD-dependent monooxygenase n=1 Tax=unclassified Terrabacter TaxID=2630222 RepID=UPI00165E725F|nr:FAD-dependent monooxygenase [Terrabacter sp. MAHUQ-38]MBC9820379.1 FAD-dependent monooxygenase [Terrabacter sp. MAHUQ-38]
MNDVTIVGSGPTGLMLAGELALAGVDVVVLERRSTPDLIGTRARGFHSRTLEIFDQRGIADRFLVAGRTSQALSFANTALEVASLPTRHPYTLGLSQSHIERILRGWVEELEVPIHRGVEVIGFAQDDAGVDLHLAEGEARRTAYVVGADGGRSVIRKTAGIEFVGARATRSHLIAEVEVTEQPPTGIRHDDVGIHGINVMDDGRTAGIVVTEPQIGAATEPTLTDLSRALTAVYGTDFGIHDPSFISRFTDATLQAAAYRCGRVLLAGDAAHTHPPTGGQGIGLGVQDAVNLGWKLAQVVQGVSPEALLDTYYAERHPTTARVLRNVMTQALLQRGDTRTEAMRDTIAEMLSFDGPRTQLAGLLSGLDVAYDLGDGHHPLLGRRMPDLDLFTAHGPRRVFELLHDARPVLLNFGEPGSIELTPWASRVQQVHADHTETWVLPVIGTVTAPTAVLIRPDGHVGWVGNGAQTGLKEALTTWFGPATSPDPAPVT